MTDKAMEQAIRARLDILSENLRQAHRRVWTRSGGRVPGSTEDDLAEWKRLGELVVIEREKLLAILNP